MPPVMHCELLVGRPSLQRHSARAAQKEQHKHCKTHVVSDCTRMDQQVSMQELPEGMLSLPALPCRSHSVMTYCEATRMTREVASSAAKPRLGDSLAMDTPMVRVTL